MCLVSVHSSSVFLRCVATPLVTQPCLRSTLPRRSSPLRGSHGFDWGVVHGWNRVPDLLTIQHPRNLGTATVFSVPPKRTTFRSHFLGVHCCASRLGAQPCLRFAMRGCASPSPFGSRPSPAFAHLRAVGQCHCHSIRRPTQQRDTTPLLDQAVCRIAVAQLRPAWLYFAVAAHFQAFHGLAIALRRFARTHGATPLPRYPSPALPLPDAALSCRRDSLPCCTVPLLCGARRRCAMPLLNYSMLCLCLYRPCNALPSIGFAARRFAVAFRRASMPCHRLAVQGFTSPSLRPAKSPP